MALRDSQTIDTFFFALIFIAAAQYLITSSTVEAQKNMLIHCYFPAGISVAVSATQKNVRPMTSNQKYTCTVTKWGKNQSNTTPYHRQYSIGKTHQIMHTSTSKTKTNVVRCFISDSVRLSHRNDVNINIFLSRSVCLNSNELVKNLRAVELGSFLSTILIYCSSYHE